MVGLLLITVQAIDPSKAKVMEIRSLLKRTMILILKDLIGWVLASMMGFGLDTLKLITATTMAMGITIMAATGIMMRIGIMRMAMKADTMAEVLMGAATEVAGTIRNTICCICYVSS